MTQALKRVDVQVGGRIRLLRTAAGWSEAELAALAGIQTSALTAIEDGHVRPEPKLIHTLSKVLGVWVSAFFDDDGAARSTVLLQEFARQKARAAAG